MADAAFRQMLMDRLVRHTSVGLRRIVGLDFETWSQANIRSGMYPYLEHESTDLLLAAVTMPHFKVWNLWVEDIFDFVQDGDRAFDNFEYLIRKLDSGGFTFYAHNAEFELKILQRFFDFEPTRIVDSAMIARCMGGSSSLDMAARQFLSGAKTSGSRSLIKLFSTCEEKPDVAYVEQHQKEWAEFKDYVAHDSHLSVQFAHFNPATGLERNFYDVTIQMNQKGWPVDRDLVRDMQTRFAQNKERALNEFHLLHPGTDELNMNSFKQLSDWCLQRGVKIQSFAEDNLRKVVPKLVKKIESTADLVKMQGYQHVLDLVQLKLELGGSSLSKLPKILESTSDDGRLRGQYMHFGAVQSGRTTGKGVQMQNLKRMPVVSDVSTVLSPAHNWTNNALAGNLRQVFTSSHPDGQLIVGDFSSIESRALAWYAEEQWKLDAYAKGHDLYLINASKFNGKPVEDQLPTDRSLGKVGELGCGYGVGALSLQAFAEKMGVNLTESAATQLVRDWRAINPGVVALWEKLENAFVAATSVGSRASDRLVRIPTTGFMIGFKMADTHGSLLRIHPQAQSIEMEVYGDRDDVILRRFFHGVYRRGRDWCYYKPSERVTGDPWVNNYINPKTKQREWFKIYGGKLTGILVQSTCRELFFNRLYALQHTLQRKKVDVIGQFHDEIILDWTPDSEMNLDQTLQVVSNIMNSQSLMPGLPFSSEIKHAYRYTK